MEHVDAVVIRAGVGGGILAKELAVAKPRVLLSERGRALSSTGFRHDELANSQGMWNRTSLRFGPGLSEVRTWRPYVDVPARRAAPSRLARDDRA